MSAMPSYRDILDLLRKGATMEAQEKIMELREAALALQEENLQLRKRLTELEERALSAQGMEFRKPFYFRSGDDQPLCPVCWEKDSKVIHLKGPTGERDWFTCPVCKWGHSLKPETDDGRIDQPWGRGGRSLTV